ncbi:MAG: tetratricopeptide (TPR) repeat protein [Planctomycetota bacterium]
MISLPVRLNGAKCAAFALAISSFSSALLAQDLVREINFVRALAKEMRFIELAKSEADRLATTFRGAGDQDRIAQLSVEVAYYGARSRSDRTLQRTLFKETVEKSQELIDRSTDGDVKLQAQQTLANASQDFGQFLIEELEIARDQTPESVPDLQKETIDVLKAGQTACAAVMSSLASERKDPQKNIEHGLMWMKGAVLKREQARADKENRSVLVDRAVEDLEEMVLDYGEESALGLRGLFEIAQCYEVKNEMDEAISWYTDTIDSLTLSLDAALEGELTLTGDMQNFLFGMMQEVYVRAGETMAREGAAGTEKLFADFRANIIKFGQEDLTVFEIVSDTYGHLMLLAEARYKAESGDPAKVQEALAMTQRINDKHPADYVGVRAKAVLSDILSVQKGLVSGALLFEVGKGDLQKKRYEPAIQGLRSAIATMTDAENKTLGLDAHSMLGDAYRRTDRSLEAIFALSNGLKAFGKKGKEGDPDPMVALSSDVADTLDRTISSHKRLTKNDTFFNKFWQDGLELAAVYSTGGANKLARKSGIAFFNDKKFAEAAAEFAKISNDYVYYEQVRVRMGRAQMSLGDFVASRKTIADYRKYVADNALGSRDNNKLKVRTAALAAAAYNDVQMAYFEARGHTGFKLERNLKNYGAATQAVQTFVSNYATDGALYLPQVLAYLGRLHVDTGALAEAEKAYTQLKVKDQARASRLASEIFQEYQNLVKSQIAEVDKAIASGKADGELQKAKSEVADARKQLTALGTDYINGSPKPQLAILVATMSNWAELREWQRVDDVAKKTLVLYGDVSDASEQRVVDLLVRPMVGEALLQQRRFQEAYDMLVAAETANPAQWDLKRQIARALGGWFEFSETGQPVRVPGLDRPVEAYMKYYGHPTESYRIWATRPDVKVYGIDWYEFMWESYWFAKQAGTKDSKFKDTAATFYRKSKSTNDFATLKQHGIKGALLHRYFRSNR